MLEEQKYLKQLEIQMNEEKQQIKVTNEKAEKVTEMEEIKKNCGKNYKALYEAKKHHHQDYNGNTVKNVGV